MDPGLLLALKALTDRTRLRVVGLLADRPRTSAELVAELVTARRRGRPPISERAVARHLDMLRAAGLVEVVETPAGPAFALRLQRLAEVGRALDALERPEGTSGPPLLDAAGRPLSPEEARVLHAFVVDDRLTSIPAQDRKRRVVLRWLLDRRFAEDRDYPEQEVNRLLAFHHPDTASLRRYLVDSGYLTRSAGVYRRSAAANGEG